MPAGQTLGPRRYFAYLNDKDTPYKVLLDQTLGLAGGLTEDDSGQTLPSGVKPRFVWAEATVNGVKVRKRIVCSRTSTLYSSVPTDVVIDTVTYRTTGRVGETMSFGVNPA